MHCGICGVIVSWEVSGVDKYVLNFAFEKQCGYVEGLIKFLINGLVFAIQLFMLNICNMCLIILQESGDNKGMYSEWTSMIPRVQAGGDCGASSVLGKFGTSVGKDVTLGIVRQLAGNLGISQAAEPSPLSTDTEVKIFEFTYVQKHIFFC